MTKPSLLVPLLSEFDQEQYRKYVLQAASRRNVEGADGQTMCAIMVPDPRDVTLTACMELLSISREQCLALMAEVPEVDDESEAYLAAVRRIYAADSLYKTVDARVAASQIAVINAVIAKYNSKIV